MSHQAAMAYNLNLLAQNRGSPIPYGSGGVAHPSPLGLGQQTSPDKELQADPIRNGSYTRTCRLQEGGKPKGRLLWYEAKVPKSTSSLIHRI